MYKKFIFFIVFLLLLSACKKEEVYYSPVLETNQTVIYQFKEENYYISQYRSEERRVGKECYS